MRFMMLVYPGPKAESGALPDPAVVERMTKYNDELRRAGVVLALDGLRPTKDGARVHFDGGTPRVVDGPFTESKELLGGYWLIEVKSREEAIEWARRAPMPPDEYIELRRVYEMDDFTNLDAKTRDHVRTIEADLMRRK